MLKKHKKATKENKGGIITKEGFVHLSNLSKFERAKNDTKIKRKYKNEIVKNLMSKLNYKNLWCSKIEKVVVNMGLGLDGNDQKKLRYVYKIFL